MNNIRQRQSEGWGGGNDGKVLAICKREDLSVNSCKKNWAQ